MVIQAVNKENSLFVTNEMAAERRHENQDSTHSKTIYAGNLNPKMDSITLKKQQAQKQAMKIVGDTFEQDKKIDESMQKLQEKYEELKQNPEENAEAIRSLRENIFDMKQERLKTSPMLEAEDSAEEIMQQASKEIIGQLRSEAVNYVEEKLQEEVEKAKEQAAKKEEQEEKLEEQKEKKEELEEMVEKNRESNHDETESSSQTKMSVEDFEEIENMVSYQTGKKKANQELEKMVDNLNLIMEDIKGAEIDVNL